MNEQPTTRTFRMSQEMIDTWAGLSGDHNPLHVSIDHARTTRFGGTIAHGHFTLALIEELLLDKHGVAWLSGGVLRGLRFRSPVRPGRTYTISLDPDDAGHRVEVRDTEDGTLAVEGQAFLESSAG